MLIYPAIDIKNGKCVMLTQGRFDKEKIYYEDPKEVAKLWKQKGAKALHIVDLDGALEGKSRNLEIIREIIKETDIPVQVGGGIRNPETIKTLIDIGADKVIIGTKAVQDEQMLKQAVNAYGEKIAVAIDAKKGYIAIDGWTKTSTVDALQFAKRIEQLGVKTIIYTDVERDGMLKGPNFKTIKDMNDSVSMDVIASGGISSIDDLEKLSEIGVAGAIVGKALYEGKINLTNLRVV
ncbi:MAG: 1-(5-phosphoribosyl)-5-[(5-phosphoribosylamino)methylideneamino]imidazole-4-carboxamide isomerase [Natronincolaceae bacterium]|jgi:phosphoribosylformimino-5-aminoimidazole carboxamide ribotide isomerase|nr:1-(5-phosphoribosyl)-5-[(5-phosphoribosylamino)methylideneamino]imidazole-4-carboxamide isomerase [Bacillota bacterium]NLK91395.1 1-(5-phosphoribosyl)-5-[(5-phosphoribosylamino)methylideneamino]imidazole-4-carboxamide isomerase [Clostridiales bacterium]